MQLPTQSFPIDRHHRNGLSNIQLSGITPSATYKGYTNQACNNHADPNFNGVAANPCGAAGANGNIVAYKRKGRFDLTWGGCQVCPGVFAPQLNNAVVNDWTAFDLR